jgi:hypothetical protein
MHGLKIQKTETTACITEQAIRNLTTSEFVTDLSASRTYLILLPQRFCHSEAMIQCVKKNLLL